MHVKFHFIMLFTFNSYILSETIVSRIHVPYNQNLIEILQTFPQQRGASSSFIDVCIHGYIEKYRLTQLISVF